MLDARPIDIDQEDPCANRSGQERPGDTWTSVFRIGPEVCGCEEVDSSVEEEIERQEAGRTDPSVERSET
jgi:hypothetical protein